MIPSSSGNAPRKATSGFALITVLAVVLLVSAVALTLASTVRVEARQALAERVALELDERVAAGQEMAGYLANRGLGTVAENFEGLPVTVLESGFHYRLQLPSGNVELYLEAEDGKLNLSTAPALLLEGFFSAWTEDSVRANALASAVQDWRDADEEGEAEKPLYASLGYGPRNRGLGIADVVLLRGFDVGDLRDQMITTEGGTRRREGLARLLTRSPVGSAVNLNFAPEVVLRGIPGLAKVQTEAIVAARREHLFRDVEDFSRRIGLPEGSPAWPYISFAKRVPAILTLARSEDGRVVRLQRRVIEPVPVFNSASGTVDTVRVTGLVERDGIPDWLVERGEDAAGGVRQ